MANFIKKYTINKGKFITKDIVISFFLYYL